MPILKVPFEISIAFFMYVGALAYAIYQAYKYGQSIDVPENESSFSQGWSFIGRKRDDFDSEWESFVDNTRKYIWWYICHVLLSEIVRQLEPHRVCFVHATVGIPFVLHTFKPIVANTMFLMVLSYYLVMMMRKGHIWMLTIVWLGVLNMLKQSVLEEWLSSTLSEKEICDAMIALSWLLLRVTSFALDYCNAQKEQPNKYSECNGTSYFSTLNYLSYSFYMPVYLHGPPLIYERYGKMYAKNQLHRVEESIDRFRELIITLARIGCVYLLNEFCMHFIYANVVIYNPDQMERMNLWAVYGFAYAIGQYFCNKYIVTYGFSLAITKFDRIDAPRKPLCVGRIHLYSQMWKYFDQGLHDFLFKHIYAEMCSRSSSLPKKLLASFASFVFIYLWHGYYFFLLVWVFLNLASLYIEIFGRHIAKSEQYSGYLRPTIGDANIQRLNAVLGGQLLISSSISNVMFIGGPDIGRWLTIHTYFSGGFLNYIILSITAYNLYRVSSFIFQCEHHPKKKIS